MLDRLKKVSQVEDAERQLATEALTAIRDVQNSGPSALQGILPPHDQLDDRALLLLGTIDTLALLGCAGIPFEEGADRLIEAAARLQALSDLLRPRKSPLLSELSPDQMPQAEDIARASNTSVAARSKPIVAAVVSTFKAHADQKAIDRERQLRLLGIPHATVRDFLDNEKVADILGKYFDTAGSINHIGVRHARAGDYEFAIALFSAANKLCPIHPEPLVNRAKAQELSGDMDSALASYEAAYVIQPYDEELTAILRKHGRMPGPNSQ